MRRHPSPWKEPRRSYVAKRPADLQSVTTFSSVAYRIFPFEEGSPGICAFRSRHALCMNLVGVADFGEPPPAYGIGAQPVATRVFPVRGSRCRPLVQYPRTPPSPETHATPAASTCTSWT